LRSCNNVTCTVGTWPCTNAHEEREAERERDCPVNTQYVGAWVCRCVWVCGCVGVRVS
jgi:hypothetical protein